mmetsp:Transcript_23141/g.39555  ORF Transcript_23141/g.39555 Transcript_23141/m.39555 type:complete len:267 (+) Transcript_23141:109-909(+)
MPLLPKQRHGSLGAAATTAVFALVSFGVARGASESSTLMRHNTASRHHEHIPSNGDHFIKIVGGISETSSGHYGNARMSPDCNATTDSMGNWTANTVPQEEQDCDTPAAAPISAPTLDALSSDETDSVDEKFEPLRKGSIVELYADTSYFATPAIITGYGDESSSITYSLENVFLNERLHDVDEQYVHPYQPYEDGTRASCSIGSLRTKRMTPCAVVSHSIRKNSLIVMYEVSYLNNDGTNTLISEVLPFSRVRRVHGRQNGELKD